MKKHTPQLCLFLLLLVLAGCQVSTGSQNLSDEPEQLKALIIDGQNNHDMWPKTTVMMKQYLEESGLFSVEVARTAFTWKGEEYLSEFPLATGRPATALEAPKTDPDFRPDFSQYDVVISNFGWRAAPWPEATQRALEQFVGNGGGLVIIHAADNSFPEWLAFNKMIGLGGWGDRTEKDGPYVYYNEAGELVRDSSAGSAGSHGPQHEYLITIREEDHPVTRGMPKQWRHAQDELYDRLRGPAENMNIQATAYSDEAYKGTGRHEPMIFTVDYGQGRVFHTPMGHADYSMECVGFIVTFTRGTEWVATGKVTQTAIPDDFPTAAETRRRKFSLVKGE